MGAVLGVLLRNYGFTDLPPSLPLPRSDPVTRNYESSLKLPPVLLRVPKSGHHLAVELFMESLKTYMCNMLIK